MTSDDGKSTLKAVSFCTEDGDFVDPYQDDRVFTILPVDAWRVQVSKDGSCVVVRACVDQKNRLCSRAFDFEEEFTNVRNYAPRPE